MEDLGAELRQVAASAGAAAAKTRELLPGGWVGAAAEAFAVEVGEASARLDAAAGAFAVATGALMGQAESLRDAQVLARRAMEAWAEAQVGAGSEGVPADLWAATLDAPGLEARERARRFLAAARESVRLAEADLAAVLREAADRAPSKPHTQGWLSKLAGVAGDVGSVIGRGALDLGADVVNAAASVANAMGQHPEDALALAAGLALMTASVGGEAAGFVLDTSMVGAPIGVAINAVSARALLVGGGMAVAAMGDIAKNAAGDASVSPLHAGGGAELTPSDVTGRTAGEIRELARQRGFEPHGNPDSTGNYRKFRDPVTKSPRLRIDDGHVDPTTGLHTTILVRRYRMRTLTTRRVFRFANLGQVTSTSH